MYKSVRYGLHLVTVLLVFFLFSSVCAVSAASPGWSLLEEVRALTEKNYVEPTSAATLEEGAVRGLLESLNDPYSEYISPEQLSGLSTMLNDEYVGVGVVIQREADHVIISGVIPNSPSHRMGIKVGSRIEAVNDRPVAGLSLDEVVKLITGEVGTYVDLTLTLPDGSRRSYYLRREVIRPTIIEYRILTGQIGYLSLKSFPRWAPEEVSGAIKQLEARGVRGLILDLRGNPGGYLDACNEIASLFLMAGKPVVRVVERDKPVQVIRSQGPGRDLPLIVLVNKGTASAAEILAAALRDNKAAILVGTKTHGKGVIQSLFPLSNGGALKLTTAYFHTPAGEVIHGVGLQPDIVVEDETEQLERARKILQEQIEMSAFRATWQGTASLGF